MNGRTYLFLLFVLVSGTTCAQEFWLSPEPPAPNIGDSVTVQARAGNDFVGQAWNLAPDRVVSATMFRAGQQTDVKSLLHDGRARHLAVDLPYSGSYLFALTTTPSQIELPAARFNTYLKEYDLEVAMKKREETHATDLPGKEQYTRFAKTLVQCGPRIDETYKQRVGFPLELMPRTNPASLKKGDDITFTVLFNDQPLFGVRAFIWNNLNGRTYTQPLYSQQDGTLDVKIFQEGMWMVSVVKMVPLDNGEADWQSYWSSFVFYVSK